MIISTFSIFVRACSSGTSIQRDWCANFLSPVEFTPINEENDDNEEKVSKTEVPKKIRYRNVNCLACEMGEDVSWHENATCYDPLNRHRPDFMSEF